MTVPGITREHPNFRTAPSLDSQVIRVLEPGTLIEVMERQGDYFHVIVDGQQGFVHIDYVLPNPGGPVSDTQPIPPPPPPAIVSPDAFAGDASLINVPLAPPPELAINGGSNVAKVWNGYGGLLTLMAGNIGIDPAVAVATLAVESGGRSAGQDGRLLIRFENHIFYKYWGAAHDAEFRQHFTFDPNVTWKGHNWRPTVNEPWRASHVDIQSVEWDAFGFACGLDDNAARLSISMGITQVMGFNHDTIGYATPAAMFDAFSRSPRYQVLGFFDFVRKNGAIPALQNADYSRFALIYNGAGQVDAYARQIRDAVAEFRALRG
jgi:hypothetical protein